MRLDHEFTVPVPAAQAWPVLLDIDRIAPCMPGATITKVDGDDFEGTVKVKVGPITVTYGGTASFLEKDEAAADRRDRGARQGDPRHRARPTPGSPRSCSTTARESTRVAVTTDLSITGKPAQFGRGVMSDVGNKLLGRFADCLAGELAGNVDGHAGPGAGRRGAGLGRVRRDGGEPGRGGRSAEPDRRRRRRPPTAGNPDSAAATESGRRRRRCWTRRAARPSRST